MEIQMDEIKKRYKGVPISNSKINWSVIDFPYMPLGIIDCTNGKIGETKYEDEKSGEMVSLEEWFKRNGRSGYLNSTPYHSAEERDRLYKEMTQKDTK
jgi:hypothetical protein